MLEVCIARDTVLPLPRAVLTGATAMTIEGKRQRLSQECSILPDEPADLEDYVQVGVVRSPRAGVSMTSLTGISITI